MCFCIPRISVAEKTVYSSRVSCFFAFDQFSKLAFEKQICIFCLAVEFVAPDLDSDFFVFRTDYFFSWLHSLTPMNTYSQNIDWRHFGAFSVSHSAPRRSTCLGLFSLDRTRHVANFNQGLSLDLKNRLLVLCPEFIVPSL